MDVKEGEKEGSKWSSDKKFHGTKCRIFKCVKVTKLISRTKVGEKN